MPQMSPLLWLSLMVMFLSSLLIFHNLIYFMKLSVGPGISVKFPKTCHKTWSW